MKSQPTERPPIAQTEFDRVTEALEAFEHVPIQIELIPTPEPEVPYAD